MVLMRHPAFFNTAFYVDWRGIDLPIQVLATTPTNLAMCFKFDEHKAEEWPQVIGIQLQK
jgi:hypothetical protein